MDAVKVKPSVFLAVDARKYIRPIKLCAKIPCPISMEHPANPDLLAKVVVKMMFMHIFVDSTPS